MSYLSTTKLLGTLRKVFLSDIVTVMCAMSADSAVWPVSSRTHSYAALQANVTSNIVVPE